MANDTTKVALPKSVVTTVLSKVKDASTIAALSPSTPQKFADSTYLVFNPTAEAEVVAEGAKKSGSEISTNPVVAKRVKVVTTTRVSDELKWADEDNQLFWSSADLTGNQTCLLSRRTFLCFGAVPI